MSREDCKRGDDKMRGAKKKETTKDKKDTTLETSQISAPRGLATVNSGAFHEENGEADDEDELHDPERKWDGQRETDKQTNKEREQTEGERERKFEDEATLSQTDFPSEEHLRVTSCAVPRHQEEHEGKIRHAHGQDDDETGPQGMAHPGPRQPQGDNHLGSPRFHHEEGTATRGTKS